MVNIGTKNLHYLVKHKSSRSHRSWLETLQFFTAELPRAQVHPFWLEKTNKLTVHFYGYQYIKWEEMKLRKTPSSKWSRCLFFPA